MKGIHSVLILLTSCLVYCYAKSNQCTDKKRSCPQETTCCPLSNGTFGCCPFENAVCCGDSIHCCPQGYICDTVEGVCQIGTKSVPLRKKIPATPTSNEIGLQLEVVCPSGEGQCPADHSCCLDATSNQVRCCPAGFFCDQGRCSATKLEFPAAILSTSKAEVVKCNQKFACPDRYTCCKANLDYSCCPWPEAVCCSNTKHCCPRGYKCSLDGKSCSFASQSIAALSTGVPKTISKSLRRFLQQIVKAVSNELLLSATGHRKQSMVFKEKVMESIVCPDGKSECPADSSCCKLSSGSWGCCPLRKAVCCSDGVHCCPQGYHCDVANGTCSRDSESLPMFQKRPATNKNVKVSYVVCPDEISECPNKSTCCKLHSGDWGCCPFPKAVCCSDGEHCCPEGHTCDIPHQTCKKTGKMFLMLNKAPALRKRTKPNNVICPDKESQCQEDQTCCKLASGEYGCCPLPHAVCCSDKLHCCPEGYRCDLSAQTCTTGIGNLPLFRKVKSSSQDDNGRSREPMLLKTSASRLVRNNIVCPGEKVMCQESQTCCEVSAGKYGCCPVPDAVCCSDDEHCCPQGYICNISAARCTQESRNVPFLRKIKAFKRVSKEKSIICPDRESECPDSNTCCKLSSGAYGCCPLPSAVCCSDGIHCCPSGYTCDLANGTCDQGSTILKILQKIPALKSAAVNRKTVEELVQRVAIPSRLSSVTKENNVICPDGSHCPDDSTCCKLSSGAYGCCPLPSAVCCSDGIHCCPSGYTCDLANGTCDQGSKILKILQKIPALKSAAVNRKTVEELVQRVAIPSRLSSVTKENNVICSDESQCPDGSTCCELSSGRYGCCPLPNAVCCSDGIHCCPSGYTCNLPAGTCDQGRGKEVGMVLNVPAVLVKTKKGVKIDYVECPDKSRCLDYETCCPTSDTEYGCCPLPHAVCCEDKTHCCPKGYRCDLVSKTCEMGTVRIPMLTKRKSARRQKPKIVNLDEKIRFTSGESKDGKAVEKLGVL